MCPAGHAAEQAWKDLVGAKPTEPGEFVLHLLSKDHGWLAAYFDAMARISSAQQAHFVQGDRLRNIYEAYRSAPATLPTVRRKASSQEMLRSCVLLTRLQWQADGEPPVPGSLQVWKEILSRKSNANNTAGLGGNPSAPQLPLKQLPRSLGRLLRL